EIIRIKDVKEFYERVYELKEDLLDYEEKVFDVKKFFKNQKEEFDKAVHQINIYEKNRTYVVDAETREVVGQIEGIIKSREPYSQIHRLPNLVDEFINHFIELLEVECKPIRLVIESDRKMVLDEIELYNFNEELEDKFKAKFDDLLERLDTANN